MFDRLNTGNVVTVNNHSFGYRYMKFKKKFSSQLVYVVTIATPLYSASTLERDTLGCRLDDHDARLSPRNTQYPDVDLHESGQPPPPQIGVQVSYDTKFWGRRDVETFISSSFRISKDVFEEIEMGLSRHM